MACCCGNPPGACCTPGVTQLVVTVSGLSSPQNGFAGSCESANKTYVYDILPTDCLTSAFKFIDGSTSFPRWDVIGGPTPYIVESDLERIRVEFRIGVSGQSAPGQPVKAVNNIATALIPFDTITRDCRTTNYTAVSWSFEYGANAIDECNVSGATVEISIQ